MTWPTGNIDSSRFDSDADRISSSRPELLKIAIDVNNIANTFDPAGAVGNSVLAYSDSTSRFEPAVDLNLVSITASGNITGGGLRAAGNVIHFSTDNRNRIELNATQIAFISNEQTRLSVASGAAQIQGNLTLTDSIGQGKLNAKGATITGNIDATGNITGNFIIGDGSQLTNLPGGAGGLSSISQDTTPQLGGNLAGAGFGIANISSLGVAGDIQVTGNITANSITGDGSGLTGILTGITGNAVGNVNMAGFALQLDQYQERVTVLGTVSGSFAPNVAAGTVQTATLTGGITMNGLAGAVAGSSMTLILTQDSVGTRVLTSNMLAPGGVAGRTLSIAPGARDVVNIFYDGDNYFMTVTQGFS